MPRPTLVIATAMALTLVASCTRSGIEAPPVAEVLPEPEARDVVVTSSRVPMPSPMVVTGSKVSGNYSVGLAANVEERRAPPPPPGYHDVGRDKFSSTAENPFKIVKDDPVSTFSLDVDTASYSFVRASLAQNVLPQPAAVRTEEMVNYFPYDYAAPKSADAPFTSNIAVFPSPWNPGRQIVRIGVRGYSLHQEQRPRANLVFLIDTSGSMNEPNKLPLVKQSLKMLVDQLGENDSVAIVTYAGYAGTALAPTSANNKVKIKAVIDGLGAGGGTAGAEGIRQAYTLAAQNLDAKGVNRVILATDGDFNIGITDNNELKGYIERERDKGVFLSVLGFGMGNYNDALMQTLAQNGNGTAAYIDTLSEARKTLVDQSGGTLFTIAKDVKVQVEFNPAVVSEYRLIGYETRMLNRDDFNNDKVDAGDVGSGQTVTAIYEITPVAARRTVDPLRYGSEEISVDKVPVGTDPCGRASCEIGFVKIRYKLPKSDTSRLISTPILEGYARFEDAPQDARFATAVAGFAELLRGGKYSGSLTYADVLRMASAARGDDPFGYRSEFLQMVRQADGARSMASQGE